MHTATNDQNQDYLFCCTFTRPGDSYLERYYSTYGISSTGQFNGIRPSRYHRLYPLYKIVDEFACIASEILSIHRFDKYSSIWFDALQCALTQASEKVERAYTSCPWQPSAKKPSAPKDSKHVQQCIERAENLERSTGHRFFLPNIERARTSPELSSGGQYYMDCKICRRTIFEDGTGSATERGCD